MTSSGVDSVHVQTQTAPYLVRHASIVLRTTGGCTVAEWVMTPYEDFMLCVSVLLLRASQYPAGCPLCCLLFC